MYRKLTSLFGTSLFMLIILLFNSCSDSTKNDDAKRLLETIPSEALAVGVADIGSLVEKVGVGETDGEIKFKGKIGSDLLVFLFDGDSGVKQSVVTLFASKKCYGITGFIADEDVFKNVVQQRSSEEWSMENGYYICEEFIVKGNQYWVLLNGVMDDFFDDMLGVTPEESVCSNVEVTDLLPVDKDLEFYIDYNKLVAMLPFEQSVTIGMVKDMLVKDWTYSTGYVNFEKEYVDVKYNYLSEKGEPAEFMLPMSDVDSKLLENLPSESDIVVAMGTSSDLWEMLQGVAEPIAASSLGALEQQIFKKVFNTLVNINKGVAVGVKIKGKDQLESGTILLQSDSNKGAEDIASGIRSFYAGIDAEEDLHMIVNGNKVEFRIKSEDVQKGIPEIAKYFDGKYGGIYISGKLLNNQFNSDIFNRVVAFGENKYSASAKLYLNISGETNSLRALIEDYKKHSEK